VGASVAAAPGSTTNALNFKASRFSALKKFYITGQNKREFNK
jgi:hypothetical protein